MMSLALTPHVASPGTCLDHLLASRFLPSRWSSPIESSSELPAPLERCARNLRADAEWRAYSDEDRILFAIARTHSLDTPADSMPAIDVYFLDDGAAVYSAGVWEYDSKHGWWLDAVLDLSYDYQEGGCLDFLGDARARIDPPPPARSVRAVALGRSTGLPRSRSTDIPPQSRASRPRRATLMNLRR
jgi:hypothetical protein